MRMYFSLRRGCSDETLDRNIPNKSLKIVAYSHELFLSGLRLYVL